MIRKQELEQVREINRKLPFAARIEPGPTFAEWAVSAGIHLMPQQVRMGEAIMRGEAVIGGRQVGKSFTRVMVERYIADGTDD